MKQENKQWLKRKKAELKNEMKEDKTNGGELNPTSMIAAGIGFLTICFFSSVIEYHPVPKVLITVVSGLLGFIFMAGGIMVWGLNDEN